MTEVSISPDHQEASHVDHPISFRDKEVLLKNGEKIVLPSIHYSQLKLFHGSPVAGITEFIDAEETTVGNGVYLTSQFDAARGYAQVRTSDGRRGNGYVYQSEIRDMDILNLTTLESMDQFAQLFRQELVTWRDEVLPKMDFAGHNEKMMRLVLEEKAQQIVTIIDQKKYRAGGLRDITFSFGDMTRRMLRDIGYDGLMTLEGGEGQIGNHDSYVIFDPERVTILDNQKVVEALKE
jgi:hypothetical protein